AGSREGPRRGTPTASPGPFREIEGGSGVGILRLQIRTVLNEEFHKRREAPLCRAMQCGLMWDGKWTGHLTASGAATDGRGRALGRAIGGNTPGLGHHSRIDVGTRIKEQLHGREHSFVGAITSASHSRSEF